MGTFYYARKEYEIRYLYFENRYWNYLKVKKGNKVIIYVDKRKEGKDEFRNI